MGLRLDVPVLQGKYVRLEPLSMSHVPDLARAVEENRSSYGFTLAPGAAEMEAYVAEQLERPELTPFAQIRSADGTAVGHTAFWGPRTGRAGTTSARSRLAGRGSRPRAQGTGINVEAKALLFGYAFETLDVARVDLKTDACNERSRQALERLGVHFEGVLRSWSPSWTPGERGALRDSAMFSVIASEWPSVRSAMTLRLTEDGARPR